MLKRIELFIGTEKDKDGNALHADVKYYAIERTRSLLASLYGGFTELPTMGGWKGPDGRIVTEAGLKYEVWSDGHAFDGAASWTRARDVAEAVRNAWHQTAVLLSVDGEGSFI